MASAFSLSNAMARKCGVAVNVDTTGLGGAVCSIYSNSTAIPANSDTALDGAAIRLAHFSFPIASGNTVSSSGVITMGAISGVTGEATGIASYFRIMASDGTTIIAQGNCGLAGSSPDMVLDNLTIAASGAVEVSASVWTVTK